jgi:hypothetical protein
MLPLHRQELLLHWRRRKAYIQRGQTKADPGDIPRANELEMVTREEILNEDV